MKLIQKQPAHHEAAIKIEGSRVLVLGLYPETAVFGCCGAILRHVAAGDALRVVIVSDGADRVANDRPIKDRDTLRQEACNAALFLGHEKPEFWGISVEDLEYGEFLIQKIQTTIESLNCDLVYAPSIFEPLQDGRILGMATLEAVRRQAKSTALAMFETEAPMMQPNLLLDISDLQARKQQAIACFESQLAHRPYGRLISAINCLRTYNLSTSVASAEAYSLVKTGEASPDFLSIFKPEYLHQQHSDSAAKPEKTPLVSVLVRSMNRSQLNDALDSLALQTYSNIEIVVINARREEHRPLGDWCGRFPIRVVSLGRALLRSSAANAGLDNAAGDYLMFLDDDDWLAPDHITNLIAAVIRQTSNKVAYTGVEFRGENRQRLDLAPFNEPFNKGRLRGGNYIPIHAVLFSRTLVAQGVRFDENFEVYEDWDFLLQLSQFSDFIHVNKVSAYYRASGTSGVGVVGDETMKRHARERVFVKWKAIWSGAQLDELVGEAARTAQEQLAQLHNQSIDQMQSLLQQAHRLLEQKELTLSVRETELTDMDRNINDLKATINGLRATVSELQARLRDQDQAISANHDRIQAILTSSSWKFSAPIRFSGRLARYAKRKWLMPLKGILRPSPCVLVTDTPAPTQGPEPIRVTGGPAYLVRDRAGHYHLSQEPSQYTYIEPERPVDIDARLASLKSAASFTIVVPVYNTATDLLDALIASVKAQWYPYWKLVLADDASSSEATRTVLDQISHPQIQLLRLEKNQGIAGATNAALAIAEGDFIVFADHDDELTVDCLYELALCIDREQPDFVYSDEDKLDERGDYIQPHFKPSWSPDTMMSTMFTGHISGVRRSLLERVGTLRTEVNGCQDWDFVLRVSEHTTRFSHVPKVLYHWRIIPESVASDIAAKPYVLDASKRVRADALVRRGLKGTVEPVAQVPGYFRVNYHLQGSPKISIIIPTRDGGDVLRRCIESVQNISTYRNFEIVILDNGSVNSTTIDYLRKLDDSENVKVIRHDQPFNFSELNNIGAQNATGELLLFLNDDTEVIAGDWLERMGGYAQLPHVGAVGAKLIYPKSSKIQHAGVINNLAVGPAHAFHNQEANMPGYFMRNLLEYNWLAVTGACLMIEAKKFATIGAFDTQFPIAYNDIDLCIRAFKNGFFNVVCQAVTLVHHESVSRGLDRVDPAKLKRLRDELHRLYKTHPDYYQFDPFHNPNLDPRGLNFEVSL